MAEKSQMFTCHGGGTSVQVTIGATAVTVWSLISTAVAAVNRVQADVLQCIIEGKTVGGTDRDAVLYGFSTGTMNSYKAAGVDVDPPFGGAAWFVKRAGSDVPATILIMFHS